MNQRWAQISFH